MHGADNNWETNIEDHPQKLYFGYSFVMRTIYTVLVYNIQVTIQYSYITYR